ncbi:unnamed protein product [marine sediment metagenome]|uniref:Uncharacterized protein n=1 Tax=marine sediment metagenome TaxID=412755 RepID=X1NXJ7_9ZZZZ
MRLIAQGTDLGELEMVEDMIPEGAQIRFVGFLSAPLHLGELAAVWQILEGHTMDELYQMSGSPRLKFKEEAK